MNKKTGKLTPKQCISRFQKLKSDRSTWESHWEELADFIMPNRNDISTTRHPGEKTNVQLLDNTAMQANELLAGALHGLLTNPNALFFELTTGDEELDNNDNVRGWLQKQTLMLHNVMNNSNFQTEVHQLYLDEVCFGTAAMSIEEDKDTIVRYASRHIKEIFVAENNKGMIDELYREFNWDAKQVVQEFGKDLPKKILDAYEKGTGEKFCILHAIYPRDIEEYGESPRRMRYVSQYIYMAEEFELKESGFREFPYVVPRWTKASGEVYGRSPGMNALPDAKTLNKMTETVLIGAQKTVDPPLQLPDDGFIMPIRTKPGGLNYYRAGSSDRIEPVFNDARIDFGFEAMRERRQRIREAYFVDQLQLNNGPQMTATEVMQRTEERTRLLGPVLGRQHSEFLRPCIDRTWDICERRGMIQDVPEELSGKVIDVKYSSLIAKSQRVSEGQNILRTVQAIAPFLEMDPNAKDLLNSDEAVKIIARIYGFPQKAINSEEQVKKTREARAEAQAQQVEAERNAQVAANAQKIAPALAAVQSA